MHDELTAFDDFLVNRIANWQCTICGCGPTGRAGIWVCAEAGAPPRACAFVVCHVCEMGGYSAFSQLDGTLRARYGLRPPPDPERAPSASPASWRAG